MMIFHSPLEQFNILLLVPLGLVSITNSTIILLFITVIFLTVFNIHSTRATFLPSR
jgi:type IV secretory pathway VirB3-like protein